MPKNKVKKWDSNSQQETFDALEELYGSLTDAYWAANTMQDKDYIKGLEDYVSDILTQLNKQAIQDRTKDFDDLTSAVKTVIPRLESAKEKIDQIIQAVKTALTVTKAIDKVIEIGLKYFG